MLFSKKALILFLAIWSLDSAGFTSDSHWAYESPVRPKLPLLANPHPEANPVDLFILHRLEEQGVLLSPLAKPEQQIRRVFIDLIGRPPITHFNSVTPNYL